MVNAAGKDKVVVDSIRSIKFLDAIETSFKPDFHFVGVVASRKERFERLQKRVRLGDPKSWEEFIQLDLLQLGDVTGEMLGYQVRQCFARTGIIVRNNSKSMKDLERKVAKFLEALK